MRWALEVLRLEKLFVVHAGKDAWPMAERIEAVPLAAVFGWLAAERPRPAQQPLDGAPATPSGATVG